MTVEAVPANSLQHASLTDVAFQEIRRRIIALEIEPGARLKLESMARELGISLTPLREALNRLAEQKLIRVETYRGFRVEPLLDVEQLGKLNRVRHLLENEAIQTFAEPPESVAFRALRTTAEEMRALCRNDVFDGMAFNLLDQRFHEQIVEASHNEILLQAYRSLNVHVQIARLFQQRAVAHGAVAAEEHMQMLDALARSDFDAASAALKDHLVNGYERLRNLLTSKTPETA